jgi:glycerol 3-phosphatase-2
MAQWPGRGRSGEDVAMTWPPAPGGTWVIDLDGVMWLAGEPITGSPEAVARLRGAGIRTVFATNNSSPTDEDLLERLRRAGITASVSDLVTSAHAVATMLAPGERAVVVADPGVRAALEARGVREVEEGPADAVVVGWTRRFDFELLAKGATWVRAGARLVGTNDDPSHPTPTGLLPGSGALLAAVASAAEVQPEVAGKPFPPMANLISSRFADVRVVVGDRPSTDGLLARRLGVLYALVLSGVTTDVDGPLQPTPDAVAPDLGTLVERFLGS